MADQPDFSQFKLMLKGHSFEDFKEGQVFEHHWGRTINAGDNSLFTTATLAHCPLYFNAEYARAHPELSVGLHFDVQELRYRDRKWEPAYRVIDATDAGAVRQEFERQLAVFQDLLGSSPTHLDSHQHGA